MAVIPSEQFLPPLLHMLARGTVRPEARTAILTMGSVALHYVDEMLYDTSLPRAIRRHLPRTISRFEPRRAAAVLVRHLAREQDGAVRYKILRGLGRLTADNPKLKLDRSVLHDLTRRTLVRAAQMLDYRLATVRAQAEEPRLRTPGGELLVAILEEKEANAIQRVFRVLGILRPDESFGLLYQGLKSRRLDRRARASSLELLEHVLEGDVRAAVIALVDDVPDAQRAARARAALANVPPPGSYRERLLEMLKDASEAVQSIAAYHIAELRMTDLAQDLRTARPDASGLLDEVIERALGMLSDPMPEGPRAA
jgi:hypothetical protein